MTVLLFRGGDSVEREVSIESAAYTEKILSKMGHTVKTVDMLPGGRFEHEGKPLLLIPGEGFMLEGKMLSADIAFPMVHGHGGEDGILQSILEAAAIPYVSEDPATSAIGMHKALQGDIFRANGLRTPCSVVVDTGKTYTSEELDDIISYIGPSVVVKPEAGGSSIGVHILPSTSANEIEKALAEVSVYDTKALIQEFIPDARELEVGVIRDTVSDSILAMGPVEVVTGSTFLDYSSKYSSLSKVIAEADLDIKAEMKDQLCTAAATAFESVGGSMYMRVDFLVKGETFYINEINTIPGMTEHSHFPVLAGGEQGLMMVFDILIHNALDRFRREKELKRSI